MSLNRVEIMGRLGQDPDAKYSQNGNIIAVFNVATDEPCKDQDGNWSKKTEWHRITLFGKQADNAMKFLHKGSMVMIEGSLQTRKWQDQQGQNRSVVEIKTKNIHFLDPKQGGNNGNDNGNNGNYQPHSYGNAPQGGNQSPYSGQGDFVPY